LSRHFARIQAAFAEHPVLVFRDQDLGAPELAAFGRRLRRAAPHALTKYRHVDCPEVSWLTNAGGDGQIDWYGVKRRHRGGTHRFDVRGRSAAAGYVAREGGALGESGILMFADMRAAWDALPEARKQLLSGLTGLPRPHAPLGAGRRAPVMGDDKGRDRQEVSGVAVRPGASRRHPVTGRSDPVFVNPMHHAWLRRHDKPAEEAWPLIDELAAHATQERFVYSPRWRVGDVLIWDERATMHRGAGDYRARRAPDHAASRSLYPN